MRSDCCTQMVASDAGGVHALCVDLNAAAAAAHWQPGLRGLAGLVRRAGVARLVVRVAANSALVPSLVRDLVVGAAGAGRGGAVVGEALTLVVIVAAGAAGGAATAEAREAWQREAARVGEAEGVRVRVVVADEEDAARGLEGGDACGGAGGAAHVVRTSLVRSSGGSDVFGAGSSLNLAKGSVAGGGGGAAKVPRAGLFCFGLL